MNSRDLIPNPLYRYLRIFAFDPSVASQLDLANIAEVTIPITWEENLEPGPVGEYIEVVDVDPASDVFYKPVNLNEPRLLAQNGLSPSERNPQFHQQMVYAVAMTTINHFEQALGRAALWSSHRPNKLEEEFVRRLRIYPHALRDRNAFYSPTKKALLFGYFPVNVLDAKNTPGTMVFTCLSHDIIAHETTHALLDGVHPRFNEAMNSDVLSFHEAFADIVALFQHFSYPGLLRDQIARTRGNLAAENLLGQLAQQFGSATGRGDALRQYLGEMNKSTGKWEPIKPDVRKLSRTQEPHERGAILVAAVFRAFLKMYRLRSLDLFRIASDGSGVLREGDIHPDLANRLANEARRAAQYTLQMCIRALDYCPPVNLTFGDYLRAIITADMDYNGDDPMYRTAFVESFQEWGIHPIGRSSMSSEGLLWPSADEIFRDARASQCRKAVRNLFKKKRQPTSEAQQYFANSRRPLPSSMEWNLESDRKAAWEAIDDHAKILWHWLILGEGRTLAKDFGLVLEENNPPPTVLHSKTDPTKIAVEVHSVRTSLRRTPRGSTATDLVVEITQRRIGYYDPNEQKEADISTEPVKFDPKNPKTFIYRAGCTLLIDPAQMKLRRVICTAGNIADNVQLDRVRSFLLNGSGPPDAFASAKVSLHEAEPFALLHHSNDE